IFSDLPKDEAHGWKYLTVGPDEKLYFQVGAPCNICMPSERHAKIYRLNLDGSGLEVVASGIRQIVGMDWHPGSKQLYFTENQRDWLSEDIPEDKLNRVTQQLFMFRDKLRVSERMNETTEGLSNTELQRAADLISKLPPPQPVSDSPHAAR